jgi:hypothetical protein
MMMKRFANMFSFSVGVADSDEGDDAENGAGVDAGEGESGEKSPVKKGKEKKSKGMASFSGDVGYSTLLLRFPRQLLRLTSLSRPARLRRSARLLKLRLTTATTLRRPLLRLRRRSPRKPRRSPRSRRSFLMMRPEVLDYLPEMLSGISGCLGEVAARSSI